MSGISAFTDKRIKIIAALEDAGVSEILRTKSEIPETLPAAVVVMKEETGFDETNSGFASTNVEFEIYLVIDADQADADLVLYTLKEDFRANYRALLYEDFEKVRYYDSTIKGTQKVRIAQL